MPSGVYIRTEETGRKISEVLKGHIGYWLDKHHSEETKEKMSQSHIGKTCSEETRGKIRQAHSGEKLSEEHKAKIGKALLGNPTWNKGLTKETDERVAKQGEFLKGHKHSKETKKKMRETENNLLKNPEYLKSKLRRRIPTSLEKRFQEIVDKNNLPYKYVGDGSFVLEGKNPDFINTNNDKIAIEVYARYYKLRDNGNIEDWKEKRNKVFKKYGWGIIYFDEIEVTEQNVLNKLKERSKNGKGFRICEKS